MSKTYYLAGPMTGLPDHNFPAFHDKAKELRASGLTIINPAELDDYLGYSNWETVMQRDILCILMGKGVCPKTFDIQHTPLTQASPVDGIVVLSGWQDSRGACWEVGMATAFLIPIYDSQLNRIHVHCHAPDIRVLKETPSHD